MPSDLEKAIVDSVCLLLGAEAGRASDSVSARFWINKQAALESALREQEPPREFKHCPTCGKFTQHALAPGMGGLCKHPFHDSAPASPAPESPAREAIQQATIATVERITALLPKIQECAKPKTKYGRGEIFARIKWDLPKLREVLKEGML